MTRKYSPETINFVFKILKSDFFKINQCNENYEKIENINFNTSNM
jgi:hypothetical protein